MKFCFITMAQVSVAELKRTVNNPALIRYSINLSMSESVFANPVLLLCRNQLKEQVTPRSAAIVNARETHKIHANRSNLANVTSVNESRVVAIVKASRMTEVVKMASATRRLPLNW